MSDKKVRFSEVVDAALKAVDDESELDGSPPSEFFEILKEAGPDLWAEVFRACVRVSKKNIRARVVEYLNGVGGVS